MGNPLSRIAPLLSFAGLVGVLPLHGQSLPVRATVSATLPHYVPSVQLASPILVPNADELADLGDEWVRAFKQFHPEADFTFVPKPTREALKDLVDGAQPMIITGRDLNAAELASFQAKFGYLPMRIPVCLDATIVFVHKGNPISSITMEQLDAIYSKDRLGGAKAPALLWSDLGVGGALGKRAIQAYARAEGATRDAFQGTVLLKGEFRPGLVGKPDPSALAEAVVKDETGIAFGSLSSWYAGVKVLPVVPYKASDARFPNQANVTSSRYPMPRLYYAYVNRAPGKPLDPGINAVLHFMLSQEGQGTVADVGILPAPTEFLTIALKRLDR